MSFAWVLVVIQLLSDKVNLVLNRWYIHIYDIQDDYGVLLMLLMLVTYTFICLQDNVLLIRVLDSMVDFNIYIYCCESHPFCLKMLPFLWVTCRWSWVVGGGSSVVSRALIHSGWVYFILFSFLMYLFLEHADVTLLLVVGLFCWGFYARIV